MQERQLNDPAEYLAPPPNDPPAYLRAEDRELTPQADLAAELRELSRSPRRLYEAPLSVRQRHLGLMEGAASW